MRLHPAVSFRVSALARFGKVRRSVDFDYKPGFRAEKIRRIRSEGVLAAEFFTATLTGS
jgi:hypothetical protein